MASLAVTQATAVTAALPPHSANSRINNHSRNVAPKNIIFSLQKCSTFTKIPPIHADIIKNGLKDDPFVAFELLRVCSKFKFIDYAFNVFRDVPNPNVFLYTALIDGLVTSGFYLDSIRLYVKMIEDCIFPDNYVITSVLKGCGLQLDFRTAAQIHGQGLKLGLSSTRSVRLKLMECYGKCRRIEDAQKLFGEMPDRDVVASTVMISCYSDLGLVENAIDVFRFVRNKDTVCWTAMIDGLVRNGEMSKALELFREMQRKYVKANEVTIVCILTACAQLGALELGKWIHSYIGAHDLALNHLVGSALVNMYSRCGSIDEAEIIFNSLQKRDVTTYNSLITGYSLNGKSSEAVEIFRRMVKEGIKPSSITFTAVLNACSHGGLVDLGFEIFESITTRYGMQPEIEHYGCMVDLLGRVGRLEDAYEFIENMKIAPDPVIWGSLLGACRIHKKFDLGERIARILINHEVTDASTFILLANVYAAQGNWESAVLARGKLKEDGIQKEPGCSSIEVANDIHEFFCGDIRHPEREAIYKKLQHLYRMLKDSKGYSPDTRGVSQDVDDLQKRWALSVHSERLAICYGLISTQPNAAIRVVKNLRVCDDCHRMIKLTSEVTGRKIVVRDRNRFHHFENGACSCGDYW